MDVRGSFSRLKKKVKHLGSKRKPDRTRPDINGESVDPVDPPSRPESHIVAGGGEGDVADTGADADASGRQTHSTGQPPQPDEPEPMPASGSGNDQGVRETVAGGGEVSQGDSHLSSNVEVAVGSGPGRGGVDADEEGGEEFYSCSSTPSTPRSGEPNGMCTLSFQLSPLIIPSDNVDTSTVPERVPETLHPDDRIELSALTDNELGRRSAVLATAKLLCGVRDSMNAFGPLKSVAGGLCLILENCDVWLPCCTLSCGTYSYPSKQRWMTKP